MMHLNNWLLEMMLPEIIFILQIKNLVYILKETGVMPIFVIFAYMPWKDTYAFITLSAIKKQQTVMWMQF